MNTTVAHDDSSPMTPHFLGKPTTKQGWWAVWVFVAALVLVVANVLVMAPMTESTTGLDALQQFYNLFTALVVFSSGILATIAIVRQHERSWAILAIAALAAVVFVFEIVEITTSAL